MTKKASASFFEKKKQKTFLTLGRRPFHQHVQFNKSFLRAFLQKSAAFFF
jgi:hypothetical protein